LAESHVNLDGALVRGVTRRAAYVAVDFPRVGLHLRGRAPRQAMPTVAAELRVWDGIVQGAPHRLPRCLEHWELRSSRGARSSILPLAFSMSGGVCLTIEFAHDDALVVVGSRATLRVLKRTSQTSATPGKESRLLSKDMARKHRTRHIPEPRR
jgi:hypothetical protein